MSIKMPESIQIPQAGLLEVLANSLGTGIQSGLQASMQNFMQERAQQKQMQQLSKILGFGEAEVGNNMPDETVSAEKAAPQMSNIARIATNPQAMMILAQTNPQMANQIQKMYDAQLQREKFEFEKHKQHLKESPITPEMKQRMGTALESQLDLLKSGDIGLGKSYKLLTEKGRENRAEFDTYRATIESVLLPLLNKGVLSKPRFDFIIKNIPSSTDTIGKIKGKIKALNKEFGLEMEIPSFNEEQLNKKETQKQTFQIGQTATNPKTGRKIQWTGTNWREMQ